jgi:hypothetical protein
MRRPLFCIVLNFRRFRIVNICIHMNGLRWRHLWVESSAHVWVSLDTASGTVALLREALRIQGILRMLQTLLKLRLIKRSGSLALDY